MYTDKDCLFCRIIAGEIPSQRIYEDEHTFAFMDINPASAGHALIIPKEHARSIHDVSPEAMAATALSAQKVANAVRDTLAPDGINLLQCNESAAGQTVFHFHLHVIPRSEGDGLGLGWPISPGDMDAIAGLATHLRTKLDE